MFAPIFAVCAASPAVTALIGTNPVRLRMFGEAQQGELVPYAVWQVVSGSPENYVNQVPDTDSYSLQVDVYATTGEQARQVAQALRNAIQPHAHIIAWRGESKDVPTNLFRFTFEVDWIVSR